MYLQGAESPFGPFPVFVDGRLACVRALSSETDFTSAVCNGALDSARQGDPGGKFLPDNVDPFGPFPVEVDVYNEVHKVREMAEVLKAMFPCDAAMYVEDIVRDVAGHGRANELNRILLALNKERYFLPSNFYCGSENLPTKIKNALECANYFKSLFPLADPDFLDAAGKKLSSKPQSTRFSWIEQLLESKSNDLVAKKKEFDAKKVSGAVLDGRNTITPSQFLELADGPVQYFTNKRVVNDVYKRSSLFCLKKEFSRLPLRVVTRVWKANNFMLFPSYQALSKCSNDITKRPRFFSMSDVPSDFDLGIMKEVRYCRHQQKIEKCLALEKEREKLKQKEAVEHGVLNQCMCCLDDAVLEEHYFLCEGGHGYCRECINQAITIALSKGDTRLSCLGQCERPFPAEILRTSVNPSLLSKWLSLVESQEAHKAFPNDVVRCPRCSYFEVIEDSRQSNTVFECKNRQCLALTCRLCGEEAHVPFKCGEVGRDTKTARRLLMEDKMTEALLRKCNTCSKRFYKTDGCNKMTCVCGSFQCYICGQSVASYDHFYSPGTPKLGTKSCPLYSDNIKLMKEAMEKGAMEAKVALQERKIAVAEKTKGLGKDDDGQSRISESRVSNNKSLLKRQAEEVTVCNIF